MKFCTKCVMPDTRPRLTYNEEGVCNACEWKEIKDTKIDWNARQKELKELCDKIRGKNKYDCIVPVSGGKDSSYVAHKMKYEYNLNILTVTITPPLETALIQKNLSNFLSHGYDNIKITPNPLITQKINKMGFIEQGRPLLSWTTCLNTAMLQVAASMRIPLIMFGEEGESEYGGSTKLRYVPFYDIKDSIDLYTYGNDPARYAEEFPKSELTLWSYPSKEVLDEFKINVGHWSYFEDWDPYDHYIFAGDHYDLHTKEKRSTGTYGNFAQLDTPLYELHTYMMYLKFGFGRCLQDACIDIRSGKITREEGIELIKKYDGEFSTDCVPLFLDYYKMTREEFDAVLDRHANKELFEKRNSLWTPKFTIK